MDKLDKLLVQWYRKGFRDECRGTSSTVSDFDAENEAYSIGAKHAEQEYRLSSDEDVIEFLKSKNIKFPEQ